MSKILIIDSIDDSSINELSKDFSISYLPKNSREEVMREIKDAIVLIARSGYEVDKEIIGHAEKLKLLVRAGTGFDNIDIAELNKRNIKYFNLPGINALSVAELVITYIFALLRDIVRVSNITKQDIWTKNSYIGYQVEGKTLGIIGYGNIGKCIADKAKMLKMKVIVSVKNSTDSRKQELLKDNVELVSNEEIYKNSDVICVAVPLNDQTRHLITLNEFKKMKQTCSFINVSRGLVVKEEDLYLALKNGIIRNAATDVYAKEKSKTILFELDNIICTPHIGAMSVETQKKIAKLVVDKIYEYKKRGILSD